MSCRGAVTVTSRCLSYIFMQCNKMFDKDVKDYDFTPNSS